MNKTIFPDVSQGVVEIHPLICLEEEYKYGVL